MINSFPGYEYVPANKSSDGNPHNMYKGVDVGFGGLVYAEPGMYYNVKVFDSASHHPHSLIAMNYFGEYTKRYKEILDLRIAIKHKDYELAGSMLDGILKPFLTDVSQSKQIAQAAKIILNSSYGLSAAKFSNPMKHPGNYNNIIALRGALFMWDLKEMIEDMGCKVISIKTDSIKVVDPPDDMLTIINKRAEDYGYEFEIENSFDRICLVNDAVYIAKLAEDDPDEPGQWTATGAQFAVPYVFKTLFSGEPIIFDDLCETKTVKSAIYLDMNEKLEDGQHDYKFVGKAGQFCPIKKGCGGGELLRDQDGKFNAVTGTKGYRWLESEVVKELNMEDSIDISYYDKLCDAAVETISQFGDFEKFIQ